MDLMFPHHECEIAQNVAMRGTRGVHYWIHNNMITIAGQKMGKSLGNFITLPQLFSGDHPKLERAYSPMTVRFFILQAHYRGTLDFSNEALEAAQKGLKRVMQAARDLYAMCGRKAPDVPYGEETFGPGAASAQAGASAQAPAGFGIAPESCGADSQAIRTIFEGIYDALCDDLNTPMALAQISEAVKIINSAKTGQISLSAADKAALCQIFDDIVFGVLGLRDEDASGSGAAAGVIDGLMQMVLESRAAAKAAKDWTTSDHIRDALAALGITVKDTKDGPEWSM